MTRFANPQPPIALRQQSSSVRQNSVEGDEYNDMNLLDADRSRIETALGIASFGTVSGITYSSNRIVSNATSPITAIGALDANAVQASTTANGSGTITVASGSQNATNSGNNFAVGDVGKVIVTAGDQARIIGSNSSATVDVADVNFTGNENAVAWYFAEQIKSRKQFMHIPVLPAADPTYINEAVRKSYVDTQISNVIPSQGSNSGKFLTTNGTSTSWGTPAFGKPYVSGNQTVSSGGTLTLTHNLGGVPTLVQLDMVCGTTNAGFTAGDVVDGASLSIATGGNAINYKVTSTQIIVNFLTAPFYWDTAGASITLADWNLNVRAYL